MARGFGYSASLALNLALVALFCVLAFRAGQGNLGRSFARTASPRINLARTPPAISRSQMTRMIRTPNAAKGTEGAAGTATAKKPPAKKSDEPYSFTPPTLNPDTPMPRFQGNTGGLLRSASFQEFYVMTFDSPKEQIFEMPTGGAAEMRKGPNLVKFARKEQCLALLAQLRTKFKINGFIYRINQAKGGEVEYLHPKDGIYPEKVHPAAKTTRGPPKLYNWETEPLAGPPLRCDIPRWAYGDEGQLAPTPLFFLWPFIYAYKFVFSEPPQYRYSDPEKLKIGPPEDWDMEAYWRQEE